MNNLMKHRIMLAAALLFMVACEGAGPTESTTPQRRSSSPEVLLDVAVAASPLVSFQFEVSANDPDVVAYGPGFRCPSRLLGRSMQVEIVVPEGIAQFTSPPPFSKIAGNNALQDATPTANYGISPTLSDNYAQYEASGFVRVACYGYYTPGIGGKALWVGTVKAVDVGRLIRVNLGAPPGYTPPYPPPPTGCEYQIFYDPETCTGPGNTGNGTGGSGPPPITQQCLQWVQVEMSYDGGATWELLWAGYAQTC